MMKPKPILGLAVIVALAPLAWAGNQAARQKAATADHARSGSAARTESTGGRNALNVRSGTRVSARLLTTLDAKKARPGQQVVAKVTQNVKQHGRVVIRKNSKLIGHIVSARATGKGSAGSTLAVTFDRLVQGKSSTALNTVVTAIVHPAMPLTAQPMGMQQPGMAPPPMNGGGAAGGGGLVGGAVDATGSAVGSVAGVAGGTAGGAFGTANQATARTGSMMMRRNPIVVTSHVAGMSNASAGAGMSNSLGSARLGSSAGASNRTAATSVFSRRKGNLQVHSGTKLQFRVVGSAQMRKPAPHR